MKRSKPFLSMLLAALILFGITSIATAATWGVSDGDDLKYSATKYTDNQFIIDQTITMSITFNVTYVGDYVTADMSEDGGTAIEVFFNTQSLDDFYGINIKSSNGINIRFIADEQRIQSQMTMINNTLSPVLDNFSMSRVGNNLIISAHGSGTGTSWTYDAEINYSPNFVLSSMSEDHFQTDGVNDAIQTVAWTLDYHSTSTTPTTSTSGPTNPAPGLPSEMMMVGLGAAAVVGVIVVVVIIKRR
ncbi:MAG: hypothetical protein ACW98U_10780 [Candidatus Thorarchaeota archaeon]